MYSGQTTLQPASWSIRLTPCEWWMCALWLSEDHIIVYKKCCDICLLKKILSLWKSFFSFKLNRVSLLKRPILKPFSAEAQHMSVYVTFVSYDNTTSRGAHGILQVLQTQESGLWNIYVLIVTLIYNHQLTRGVRTVLETCCSLKLLHQVTHTAPYFITILTRRARIV